VTEVRSLDHLVRDSAISHPGALAVSAPDGTLTYRALDEESNRISRALAARGVQRGDRVALWLDKSTRLVAAMQGVLRLGAAYVPIDPTGPAGRAAHVIADCGARVVVTTPTRAAAYSAAAGGTRPGLLTDWSEVAAQPAATLPAPGTTPDDPAYILYTSGSTGEPKGVCLSHANALAFVDWAVGMLGAEHTDRFANHAPPQFDLSVLDLYAAFRVGASVHLVPQELAYVPDRLMAFLHEQAVTVWYSVPSALVLMTRDAGLAEHRPPGLRAVLFAGEPYPVAHLRRLRNAWPDVRFLNLYGPTETNVCTFHEVPLLDEGSTRPVPIGRACEGTRVWAELDDGRPAEPGVEGELVVDGPTVMLGYWGAPPQRNRPYRTGDRVVLGADGTYSYRGRRDGMVKVRGHRIELGEIEEVLHAHPRIVEAAATVEGDGLEARLVAWVVPSGDGAPDLIDLKRHCAGLLPRYMIVDSLRLVAELPRTSTGKVDRLGLVRAHHVAG
jgi:amino acid adenylation domain-containing protein